MFWIFNHKKKLHEVREDAKKGFESVKKDMTAISDWIKHLDSEKNTHKNDITELKSILSTLKEDVEELKEAVKLMNTLNPTPTLQQAFKTNNDLFEKHAGVLSVQTGVQTGVQTPNSMNLSLFSVTERAIIGILLNSDLKLSYEDLAAMLGKEKSTIRGQINTIKSKSESLIQEIIESNGKKRVFIPLEVKEKILKKQKVRANNEKKQKKEEE